MYPGYVFIEMEMNDATWHLVNSTPRVINSSGTTTPWCSPTPKSPTS